jgi:hypothetical protein
MIKISLILPEYVDSVWGEIEGYMEKAAEHSYGRHIQILSLMTGQM